MFKNKPPKPTIIPRNKHSISRENIPRNVLNILYHLKKSGYAAYLVGGGVRDLLVGLHPKDFDIATDARPEQIKKLFHNCRIIGRRFRLAHIFFGREIIEVATFRATPIDDDDEDTNCDLKLTEHGMLLRDNVYGTIAEDAMRRDFTINALYYNIQDFSVIDYTGGIKDLKKGLIRMIGDPEKRYHEDPVRMLRAVRIAAKLGFKIEKHTEKPIKNIAGLIQNIAPARLFDETLKWFKSGKSVEVFELLRNHGLFAMLFPQTEACFDVGENDKQICSLLRNAFCDTDARFKEDKPSNPAYLLAVLLWPAVQHRMKFYKADGVKTITAFLLAQKEVLKKQKQHITIPLRLRLMIEEIWILQHRLWERRKNKIYHISHHPKFRAAYDFMALRAKSGEKDLTECVAWWRNKYEAK